MALGNDRYGAGAVMVYSILNPYTGETVTRVSGGLVVFDWQHLTVTTADAIPEYASSDPSFDIQMGGVPLDPDPGIIRSGSTHVVLNASGDSRLSRVIQCAGPTAAGIAGGIIFGLMYPPNAAALAVLAANPLWSAIALGVGSISIALITCNGLVQ